MQVQVGMRVQVNASRYHGDARANGKVGTVIEDRTEEEDDMVWRQHLVAFDDGSRGTIIDYNMREV